MVFLRPQSTFAIVQWEPPGRISAPRAPLPPTSPRTEDSNTTTRTPNDADRRFLARDILRALGNGDHQIAGHLERRGNAGASMDKSEGTGLTGPHLPEIRPSESELGNASPSFQNQQHHDLQRRVLSLCTEFYGRAEALLKQAGPPVITQYYPVNVNPHQLLTEAKRRCLDLREPPLVSIVSHPQPITEPPVKVKPALAPTSVFPIPPSLSRVRQPPHPPHKRRLTSPEHCSLSVVQ
ncbi:hypothetical protein B0H11DRAFT_2238735 [Mycena galericulata]|nr:hypothetical protein B0H11DRAFT_2238735 [Mycena galericulata]